MKGVVLALMLTSCAWAQAARSGEQLFTTSCGSGYCHGGGGAGGGAPRLAARGFTRQYITATMTNGVQGTAMAAFGQSLARADFNAIADYVARLNGEVAQGAAGRGAAPAKLTAAAARGKVLFSEAARAFGRCSTCHEVEGHGLAVAAPIRTVPVSVAALKGLTTPRVLTATVAGDAMPALMVANRSASVVFYDLTVAPPVLRTEAPGAVSTKEGSAWRHAGALGTYTDAELTSILAYLRAAR